MTNCLVGTSGFGATPGGLFGQPAQTNSLFKPFGQATATTQNTGFSFNGTNTMGQANTSSMVSPHNPGRVPDCSTDAGIQSCFSLSEGCFLILCDQGLFANTAASQAGGLFGNTANTSTATGFGTGTGLFGQPNTGFGNVGTQVTGGEL